MLYDTNGPLEDRADNSSYLEPEEVDVYIGDGAEEEDEVFVPPPDDTPEEVTAEQAAQSTIPLTTETEPEEPHIAALVCEVCLELNLTTKSVIKCARCEQAFCFHFASSVDAQYCVNCMSEIEVDKSVITKTYEHRNAEDGTVSYYRRKAREIQIKGLDWLFAQRKISELADVELDMAIEYHRNICSLMMAESEKRRNDKMHRYAGVKVSIPTPSTTTVMEGTTTTVKKTHTVSKNKASESAAAILNSMMAKGMSIGDILASLKAKK